MSPDLNLYNISRHCTKFQNSFYVRKVSILRTFFERIFINIAFNFKI